MYMHSSVLSSSHIRVQVTWIGFPEILTIHTLRRGWGLETPINKFHYSDPFGQTSPDRFVNGSSAQFYLMCTKMSRPKC